MLDESPTTDAEAIKVEDPGVVPQGIWGSGGGQLPTEPAGTAKKGDAFAVEDPIPAITDFSQAYVRLVNAVANRLGSGTNGLGSCVGSVMAGV